ncbi:MAG: hypothetical protein U1A78_07115 [Polyangia bacterium]
MSSPFSERSPTLALLPLRLAAGYELLLLGLGHTAAGWLTQPQLGTHAASWRIAGRGLSALAPLLGHVAAHGQAYSRLVCVAELLTGAALVLGLFSRVMALVPLLGIVFLRLVAGEALSDGPLLLLGAALGSLAWAGAGRVLGLDGFLRERLPGWLRWLCD